MSKKGKPTRDAHWAEAKRKCRLNAETLRMAKELDLNPRSLIKNIPNKAEPWKAPVHAWIREMHEKRQAKAARRRAGQGEERAINENESPADAITILDVKQQRDQVPHDHGARAGDQKLIPFPGDWVHGDLDDDECWDFEEGGRFNDDPPGDKEIAEESEAMLRRMTGGALFCEQCADEAMIPSVHC